jgi:hypothetical protein
LAELHGGAVTLDSAPGRGTRVTLLLPLKQQPATDDAGSEEQRFRSSLAG